MRSSGAIALVPCLAGCLAAQSSGHARSDGHAGPRPPSNARPGDVWANPKDSAELCYVPVRQFMMGMTDDGVEAIRRVAVRLKIKGTTDGKPQRSVHLGVYWMYRHEVTVAQLRRFCSQTGRRMPAAPPPGWKDTQAIMNVAGHYAQAYADWAGVPLDSRQWSRSATHMAPLYLHQMHNGYTIGSEDTTMATERKAAAVRLRADTHGLLDALVHDTGLTRTGVIELAIRDLAKRRMVVSAHPAVPSASRVCRSLRGMVAGLPGGSEEFLRLKRDDKTREDRDRSEPPA